MKQWIVSVFLGLGLILSPLLTAAQSSPFIIKLGEARTKKSLLAFPALQFQGTPGASGNYQSVGAELFKVISNDLAVSSYFTFLDQKAMPAEQLTKGLRPAPGEPNGFSYQAWSQMDLDFMIRGGFTTVGKQVEFEVYLYHVPKMSLVFGKKYKGTTGTIRKMAHIFANDVLENLTGTKGPFLSRVAVASDRGGNQWREIWLMDWDGADADKITNYRSLAMSPAWSKDGRYVAYTAAVSKRRGGARNHDLFLYDTTTGVSTLTSFEPGMNSGATFTPDGNHIYLTVSKGHSPDIYRMNYSGKLLLRMTNGPSGAMNVEPTVSPDGSKIAFSSDRSGRTMIFTMNASDGGNVKRLTQAGQFNASPAWSPDGTKIAFAGFEENHFDIFVMNADGTGMIRLTKATKKNGRAANNEDPSFSPDGRFVMYTSDRTGKNQIYISTVDGSEERQVTEDSHNYYKPRWSGNME